MTVYVLPYRDEAVGKEFDVTTRSTTEYRNLSPMLLGPVWMEGHGLWSKNVENAWQYSKVYNEHLCPSDCPDAFSPVDPHPNDEWYKWAAKGWGKEWADRYPMGKGRKPEFSWWYDGPWGYLEARKEIYVPLYRQALAPVWPLVEDIYEASIEGDVTIRDFDAYNHHKMDRTLNDVLNDPSRKMGHGFVVAMVLEEMSKNES